MLVRFHQLLYHSKNAAVREEENVAFWRFPERVAGRNRRMVAVGIGIADLSDNKEPE